MIKSILDVTREEAEILGRIGFTHKAGLHHDICTALAKGKSHDKIAEEFNLQELKTLRWIRQHKCPECKR